MLFDPAIDVSALSTAELDAMIQSLQGGGGGAQPAMAALPFALFAKEQPALFSQMGSFFDNSELFGKGAQLSATTTINLHDLVKNDHDSMAASHAHHMHAPGSPCTSGDETASSHDGSVSPSPSPIHKKASPTAAAKGGSRRSTGKREKKYIRTKSGCLCCRAKRVKCGEEHPNCKRCVGAKRECVWPTPASGAEEGNKSSSGSSAGDESPEQHTVALPAAPRASARSIRGVERNSSSTRPKVVIPTSFAAASAAVTSALSSSTSYYSANHLSIPSSAGSARNSVSPGSSPLADFHALAFPPAEPIESFPITPRSIFDVAPDVDHLTGFALGSPSAAATTGGADLLSNPMALLPWFPTPEERGLILHFCQNSAAILMAIPSAVNPILSVLLPLALSAPRGLSAPTDALRLSLLCVSATHQAYLLSRAQAPPAILSKALDLAIGLREDAGALIKTVGLTGPVAGDAADALLAASVMMGVVNVMLGGHSWKDNFEAAKAIVEARGGPTAMLADANVSALADGVSVSRARLMLEILATQEVLGSLVSEQQGATLISEGTWWAAETQLSYHTQSVENQFGVSRATISLLAQASSLVTRATHASCVVTERSDEDMSSLFLESFSDHPDCGNEPDVVGIRRDATEVLINADALLVAGAMDAQRLRDGNAAYLNAIKILVLRNVFKCSRSDVRVQKAALNVLEACTASVAAYQPLHLTWPIILASTQVDAPARPWALTVLEGFRSQCCFNVDSAEKIIREVWTRLDQGIEWTDWKAVVEDLEMKILLT